MTPEQKFALWTLLISQAVAVSTVLLNNFFADHKEERSHRRQLKKERIEATRKLYEESLSFLEDIAMDGENILQCAAITHENTAEDFVSFSELCKKLRKQSAKLSLYAGDEIIFHWNHYTAKLVSHWNTLDTSSFDVTKDEVKISQSELYEDHWKLAEAMRSHLAKLEGIKPYWTKEFLKTMSPKNEQKPVIS